MARSPRKPTSPRSPPSSPRLPAAAPADPASPETPRRRRRTPEEAKTLICDTAERLFADRGPDRVSVLDVAVAAGVSHSLVLHYFKTYAELVRSVLNRRNQLAFQRIKQRLIEHTTGKASGGVGAAPDELLGIIVQVLCDPLHARLLTWAALSGEGPSLKLVKTRGLEPFVDLVTELLAAQRSQRQSPARLSRQRIEEAILVAIAAVHGYSTGKSVYTPALGHSDVGALDHRFQHALAVMLRSYLGESE